MLKAVVTAIWAGVAVSALCGCGTVHNFVGDSSDPGPCQVFGGVRSDVSAGVKCLQEPKAKGEDSAVQDYAKLTGLYLLAVDLPLSTVGDTLTLPWTVLIQLVGKPETPPGSQAKSNRDRLLQNAESGEDEAP